jgi:hypothetical protein
MRNVYTSFVEMLERSRRLGRLICRSVDNIKMDIRETWLELWIGFIWLRIGTGGRL